MNPSSPIGVGLALAAMPRFSVAKRHVGKRRPYISSHRYGSVVSNRRSTFQRAFTLVEVLAALLLMAIIIPVAMDGMSVASRAGLLGQRKAAAMRVAERVLNGLIVEGETQGSTSGNTSEGDINYPWAMKSETWAEDAMLHLTVTVTFSVQGNNYDVSVSTLIAPPSSSSTTTL
jgi:prepilin-type N-terminal cleavage/methylation domain-containing protein